MTGWLVLRVFAGSEIRVADDINAAGFEAFCPVVTKPRRHRYDRAEAVEVSRGLFPGYLFLRPCPDFRRQYFENSRTSIRVFYKPLVREETIAAIRTLADLESRWRVEQVGEVARLMRGVLAGELGKVLKIKRDKAVIDVLRDGNRTQVTVRVDDLERELRVAI